MDHSLITESAQASDRPPNAPSPISLARDIHLNVILSLAHPEQTRYLDALQKDAQLVAPRYVERHGQTIDANADYRGTVRELLAKGFSSIGGNGPEVGMTEYGYITCTELYNQVNVDGRHMFQARRVVADPLGETKVLDLGIPWDGKTNRVYTSSKQK